MSEVWILGGAGRTGRATAAELRRRGIEPTLVGRDARRLAEAAGAGRTVVAGDVEAMTAEIRRQRPAVVVNTVGPFTRTAAPLVRACLAAGHYLDLANDLASFTTTLGLGDAAASAGRTVVTGAGFGAAATESVVVKLCEGRGTPDRVRTDMIPSIAVEGGVTGEALAGSLVEGLPGLEGGGRYQGRRYRGGRLAPARIGGDPAELTLPDGSTVTTAAVPLGELMAAQRASGAPDVVSASSEAPSSPVARAILPVATALLTIGPVREFARRRLAAVTTQPKEKPREYSWGHAVVHWPDGVTREGWLRVGEAMSFTAAVAADVARRLLAGEGRPGAYTPAALFGPALAEACGGDYLLPDSPAGTRI
ncbi:saccharopine dehydrogenase NADP-binding domain-containing protein [Nonomuraea fuscirosea]|uniref:saccharopine dehydrogenase NADP-binding domain-containing protein n=1 Tax=Nonomuraea fuscirosea TaxID=1291556 RepID=UPI00342A4480